MKRILLAVVLINAVCFAQKENDFYKETNHLVSKTVDLVKDYKAKPNDGKDDTAKLQKAIDALARNKRGGKIIIPEGKFHFMKVKMKSNVHLEIDSRATLVSSEPRGVMFMFGLESKKHPDAAVTIRNVSIRSNNGKKFTVDLSAGNRSNKLAFANFKNVNNFWLSDFNVLDNFTSLSCITLNISTYNNKFFRAENGVIKNGHMINGHFGYGLIQAQAGKNILFKDLSSLDGGITLRMETGNDMLLAAPKTINLDQMYGRNISAENGHGGVMMGPHTRTNGHVDIDGVYTKSCVLAAGMGGVGFVNKEEARAGHTGGTFAKTSIVKNVHAVFGLKAQLKPKNFREIPCELHSLISPKVLPDGDSYRGPSAGTARNLNPDVTFINITQEGFEYQPKALLTKKGNFKCDDTPKLEKALKIEKTNKKSKKSKKGKSLKKGKSSKKKKH